MRNAEWRSEKTPPPADPENRIRKAALGGWGGSNLTLSANYPGTAPSTPLHTEQTGHVSASLPGFQVNVMKGGDSGAPNLLPMPGELVFCGGRTTSDPSAQMQIDIDKLCRMEHLDPKRYQLQW